MKTNRIIITLICFMLGFAACAQTPSVSSKTGKQTEVLVPGYKLFPTTNMWIFLKLDTSKGLVSMVQYSIEDKNRLEIPINYIPFASGSDAIPGRFNLYATQNMWTFILLDEVDGRTWQVQWSTDGKEVIVPINAGSNIYSIQFSYPSDNRGAGLRLVPPVLCPQRHRPKDFPSQC